MTNRLTLPHKIFLGYFVALGITVGGTGFGLSIGSSWVNEANRERKHINQELKLLNNLLNTTLTLQPITDVYPYLQEPQEFQQAIDRVNNFQKILTEVNSNNSTKLEKLVNKYNANLVKFAQDSKKTLKRVESSQLKSQENQVKQLVETLVASDSRIQTLKFIDELQGLLQSIENLQQESEKNLERAEILRLVVAIFSLIISLTISCFIAMYSSRMISKPISTVTDLTERALKEANYDLEIPVIGNIESIKFANSINQLFEQLKINIQKQEEAKISADAASYAKSEFMANMSHELRTPLNGILGYTQILQGSPNLSKKEERGIEIIHRCGKHLLTLINDILDFSKIEAHQIKLHSSDFHLPSFLQGIVEICKIKTEQKGLMFIYLTPENLPSGIHSDKRRLRQVLINLLSNAIKFTDKGCVTLQVEVLEIIKEPFSEKVRLLFHIEDTGIGMKPEVLDKIFLPFEQAGDKNKQTEGTGLGLTISRKIAELMGSGIQVESNFGSGSKFWFDADLKVSKENIQEKSDLSINKQIIGLKHGKPNILIVDDQWENRSFIVSCLKTIGFYCFEASNGKEGLIKAEEIKPDLIITDISMPEMDGLEMMEILRNNQEFINIPIIVSSASVYEKDVKQSLAFGANKFLTKPIQIDNLLQILKNYIHLEWIYA